MRVALRVSMSMALMVLMSVLSSSLVVRSFYHGWGPLAPFHRTGGLDPVTSVPHHGHTIPRREGRCMDPGSHFPPGSVQSSGDQMPGLLALTALGDDAVFDQGGRGKVDIVVVECTTTRVENLTAVDTAFGHLT